MESPSYPDRVTGFAAAVTTRRIERDLTQGQLADAAAIAPATYSRRLRRNNWTLAEMKAIASALDTSLAELVAEIEDAA